MNLWSEYRHGGNVLRGIVKLPTGKTSVGNGTGKADVSIDAIVSKEASKLVEVSGYGGYEWRGKPTASIHPEARSAGAPASRSRRASRCASSVS